MIASRSKHLVCFQQKLCMWTWKCDGKVDKILQTLVWSKRNASGNSTEMRHAIAGSREKEGYVETVKPRHALEKKRQINVAIRAYLDQVHSKKKFLTQKQNEFELGKRHLANIMGVHPSLMTQENIDQAIEYLFPSGLTSPRARPIMRPAEEIYPKLSEMKFDAQGRPFDFRFYTLRPRFYALMSEIAEKTEYVTAYEDSKRRQNCQADPSQALVLSGTMWLSLEQLEKKCDGESLTEAMHLQFLAANDYLSLLPYAHLVRDFIFECRVGGGVAGVEASKQIHIIEKMLPEIQMEAENGKRYAIGTGHKKRTWATVRLSDAGTGQFTVDGYSIDQYRNILIREILLSPMIVLNCLGGYDVSATTYQRKRPQGNEPEGVGEGGSVCRAMAVRHGLSLALCSFVSQSQREMLRLAGLLTFDPRRRERKKINQPGARSKWIWKAR